MSTLYITHPACLDHITPLGHPERSERLKVVDRVLEGEKFALLAREQAPAAALDTIALAHPLDYVEQIREACPTVGMVRVDADTSMSPGSFAAATRAVGAATRAVDEVMAAKAANAFCAVRPPGHHAETARPMGFCLFRSRPATPRSSTGSIASPSSISTSTTAMAARRSSGTIRP